MPPITLKQLGITITQAISITPHHKVKYLVTTQTNNKTTKTYIFARQQPTLLLALSLKRYLNQVNPSISILQVENLITNMKLFN